MTTSSSGASREQSRGAFAATDLSSMGFSTGHMSAGQSLNWFPQPTNALEESQRHARAGIKYFNEGQYRAALDYFQQAVALVPQNPDYHRYLAGAAEKLDERALVEHHFAEAIRIDPRFGEPHDILAMYFRRIGKMEQALHHSARAIELEPANRRYLINRAYVLVADGQREAAWWIIAPMVSDTEPTDRWLADLYARLAPAYGKSDHALAVARKAAEMSGLSNTPDGRPMMHFAAAALLDRMGRYDEAFEQARLGNELVSLTLPTFHPEYTTAWINRKIAYFTRERFDALPRANHGNRRPVFIVGLPRSGTSLVEQILACHPDVFACGELGFLGNISHQIPSAEWTLRDPYPECFDNLTIRQANLLAGGYLAAVESIHGSYGRYTTDKLPLNFMNLELVELLFPGAHVIHCTRDPRDACLSCYMTNFSGGNEFKFDLAHVGIFYRDYQRMMTHWKSALSVPIHEVSYESVVNDTETQVRRLLEFLDLSWEPACLRYYESRRRVMTASEDQVRRPIYTSSIGRWKNYETHLGPLLAQLSQP